MPRFTTGHSFDDIDNFCVIYFFFFFAAFFLAAFFLVAIVEITPFPLARFCVAVNDHATASIFLIAKSSIQNFVLDCDLIHQPGWPNSTSFERKLTSLSTPKLISGLTGVTEAAGPALGGGQLFHNVPRGDRVLGHDQLRDALAALDDERRIAQIHQ